MLSVIIICGVDTTEQHIVAMAEEVKSKAGPRDCVDVKRLPITLRVNSSTAKLQAP